MQSIAGMTTSEIQEMCQINLKRYSCYLNSLASDNPLTAYQNENGFASLFGNPSQITATEKQSLFSQFGNITTQMTAAQKQSFLNQCYLVTNYQQNPHYAGMHILPQNTQNGPINGPQ
jgi:hypothetical protein